LAHDLAAVRLLAGDATGYRDLCATILRTVDNLSDPHAIHLVSRACSLRTEPVSDVTIPVRLAERAVALGPENAWLLYALGAAHYRAAQYDDAIARLEESLRVHPAWLGRGQNYVVLAMACHHLGRSDEARDWLANAQASLRELESALAIRAHGFADSDYMSDWLTLLVLLPEAEACLRAPTVTGQTSLELGGR
jgi:tetratricopeptide (TPR) repeat protein